MSRIMIEGGRTLCGEHTVQGSKNAVLPILAASVLVSGESVLFGCPDITDVYETLELMKKLGCRISGNCRELRIDASEIISEEVTDKSAVNSRASVMLMGALLGRVKKAVVSYPGGCTIGCRPIDMHLSALRKMGVLIQETTDRVVCETKSILSSVVVFPMISVGATESVILATVLSESTVRIKNAACEPEIKYMCDYLRRCGAQIYGDGTREITVKGVQKLSPCEYTIPYDRIVCGTYLFAAAATGGRIVLHNTNCFDMQAVLDTLCESGCQIQCYDNTIALKAPKHLRAVPYTQTESFPGFPTDMQSQLSALLCIADGTSMVRETIFERRFHVIPELRKMGAAIEVSDDILLIEGKKRLKGNMVSAKELRGSAALVIAGLAAEGITMIDTDQYLLRGYQDIVVDLQQLGAGISRA